MLFPDRQVRPVHRDLPVPSDGVCMDDFRLGHLVLVDASADPDVGHSGAADFLE